MTIICCKCLKTKTEEGWIMLPTAGADGRSSHGYCPACYQETMEKIRGHRLRHHPPATPTPTAP